MKSRFCPGVIRFLVYLILLVLFLSISGTAFAATSKQLKQKKSKEENTIRIDYVDENGTVTLATDRRYATMVKTLDENGKTVQVFYYDENGKPTACWRGYWGYRKEGGKTVYLGPWGILILLPHLFLQRMPYMVAVTAIALMILPVFLPKKALWFLLLAYTVFIVYMTLMFRTAGSSRGRFELFWAYRSFFTSKYTRQQIIYNILLFVPLGSILAALKGKKPTGWLLLLLPVFLSFVIECTQYYTGLGTFELDDVFNNGIGGVVGFLISAGLTSVVSRGQNKKRADEY